MDSPTTPPEPDVPASLTALWPGASFGGYRIEGILGRGGMGVVYRAEQTGLERDVALKIVRADLSTPHVLKRFEFEAEVLGRLKHPGIAHVYEAARHTNYVGLALTQAASAVAAQGRAEEAFALLGRAAGHGPLDPGLLAHESFDGLRGDARFAGYANG